MVTSTIVSNPAVYKDFRKGDLIIHTSTDVIVMVTRKTIIKYREEVFGVILHSPLKEDIGTFASFDKDSFVPWKGTLQISSP